MERADSFSYSAEQASPAGSAVPGRPSIDRLELMKQQWVQQSEEEQAEAAIALYAKAARQWMQSEAEEGAAQSGLNEEELEIMSQELKLRQKCLDIAAQVLVDGLEDELDSEDET